MNDLLAALLLGIIEGITEFLPISSTGHLLIAERWLGHRSDLFNISIQAGAILAVVLIYRERLLALARGFGEPRKRDYTLKLLLAFAVTGALGIVVKKLGFELPESIAPVAWALLLGGFVILAVEAIDARRPDLPDDDPDAIGWGTAVLVGLAQVLAGVFPGTSRSAAAIFAALLFGKSSRLAATEFAFLVGIPTMFAATGYELIDMLRDGSAANEDWTALAVAFVASAITAFIAVKWLLRYIQTHRFTIFAWYRIAFGAALLIWLQVGATTPLLAMGSASVAPPSTQEQRADRRAVDDPSPTPTTARAATAGGGLWRAAPQPSDTGYAREQDVARFQAAKLCVQAAMYRHLVAGASLETFIGSAGHPNLSDKDRQRGLDGAKALYDLMDRADVECPESKADTDGSIYELALRAAQAGDAQAATCYVGGAFPMPKRSWNDNEAAQTRFRENAIPLIERGLEQGDWSMLRLARLSVSPKRHRISYAPVVGNSQPGLVLVMNAFQGGDAERAYRLARLQQIGAAPSVGENYDSGFVDFIANSLSEVQRQAADAWAQDAFVRYFQGRRWERRDLEPCPLG